MSNSILTTIDTNEKIKNKTTSRKNLKSLCVYFLYFTKKANLYCEE